MCSEPHDQGKKIFLSINSNKSRALKPNQKIPFWNRLKLKLSIVNKNVCNISLPQKVATPVFFPKSSHLTPLATRQKWQNTIFCIFQVGNSVLNIYPQRNDIRNRKVGSWSTIPEIKEISDLFLTLHSRISLKFKRASPYLWQKF